MKVILQKSVPGLGDLGELKEVADGYARNYLLPHKLVITAHVGSTRALDHQKRILKYKAQKRKTTMKTLAENLQELGVLEIEARVGAQDKLFGSVTNVQVCQLLAKKGIVIDRRKVELREKIRSIGTYPLKVSLMDGISIDLELKVVPDAASIKKAESMKKKLAQKKPRSQEQTQPDAGSEAKVQPVESGSEGEPTPPKAAEETATTTPEVAQASETDRASREARPTESIEPTEKTGDGA